MIYEKCVYCDDDIIYWVDGNAFYPYCGLCNDCADRINKKLFPLKERLTKYMLPQTKIVRNNIINEIISEIVKDITT